MIFVTVGTHEQPFNRLLREVDRLVANAFVQEKVIMQIGYSDYIPKNCEYHKFLSLQEMQKNIEEARIVITHGGPASFLAVLQNNKIPIVVPRQEKYHEHINNHQVDFVKFLEKKQNNIIPVYNIKVLKNVIHDYNHEISKRQNMELSNNRKFNYGFSEIINSMFN